MQRNNEFGHLAEYNVKNFIWKSQAQNVVEKLFLDHFLKLSKLIISQDQ